jgi:hypothetical protein
MRAVIGMCYAPEQPGWRHTVVRLVDVFVDGLRMQSDKSSPSTPKATRRKTATPKD